MADTKPTAKISLEVPDDPEQARQLMILAGNSVQAKQNLAEIAKEQRKVADKASALRMTHDSMLAMRQAMRGDLADVNPLRKPRGSGDDETETTETEAPKNGETA